MQQQRQQQLKQQPGSSASQNLQPQQQQPHQPLQQQPVKEELSEPQPPEAGEKKNAEGKESPEKNGAGEKGKGGRKSLDLKKEAEERYKQFEHADVHGPFFGEHGYVMRRLLQRHIASCTKDESKFELPKKLFSIMDQGIALYRQ
eukprot:5327203-Karenia_brevis.AAC.1